MLHKNTQAHTGYTLVELILALGIISFISMAVITFQISVIRGSATMQAGLITQQQVRKTFSQFSHEARTAVPAPSGAAALLEVATSSFIFYANIDTDADIERVKYFLGTTSAIARTEFYKQVINPVGGVYANSNELLSVMVQSIVGTTTPIFTYYNSNYAGTSTPLVQPVTTTAVRHIKMALPVDPNAGRSPIFQTYSTQVTLRNLKDNL